MTTEQRWFKVDYWSSWLKIDSITIMAAVAFIFIFWIWESTRWKIDPLFMLFSFLGMSLIVPIALLSWEYWNFLHSVKAVRCDEYSIEFRWQSKPLFLDSIQLKEIASIQVAGGTRGLLIIILTNGRELLAFPLGYDSEAMRSILESWRRVLERSGDSLVIEESRGLGLRAYLMHPKSASAKWST